VQTPGEQSGLEGQVLPIGEPVQVQAVVVPLVSKMLPNES